MSWWQIVASLAAGLLLLWGVLVAALWFTRPDETRLRDAVRLLPDLAGLIRRLLHDPEVPRGVRIRLGLLVGYLVFPIDLVPDFLPVVGYADDAILVALTLRSVVRRAGADALDRNWPGTPEGLAAVRRLAGIG